MLFPFNVSLVCRNFYVCQMFSIAKFCCRSTFFKFIATAGPFLVQLVDCWLCSNFLQPCLQAVHTCVHNYVHVCYAPAHAEALVVNISLQYQDFQLNNFTWCILTLLLYFSFSFHLATIYCRCRKIIFIFIGC